MVVELKIAKGNKMNNEIDNYIEYITANFDNLPYKMNITQLVFEFNPSSIDNCGDYVVRFDSNYNRYNIFRGVGPYCLTLENFSNIVIEFNEEYEKYVGYLWIPTNHYNKLSDDAELKLMKLANDNLKVKKKELLSRYS